MTIVSGSCTEAPKVESIVDMTIEEISGRCTPGTFLTVADPTGLSVCSGTPTLTISRPHGISPGVRAVAEVRLEN